MSSWSSHDHTSESTTRGTVYDSTSERWGEEQQRWRHFARIGSTVFETDETGAAL